MSHLELKELGMFRLATRKLRGDLTTLYKFLRCCLMEDGEYLFSVLWWIRSGQIGLNYKEYFN